MEIAGTTDRQVPTAVLKKRSRIRESEVAFAKSDSDCGALEGTPLAVKDMSEIANKRTIY
jgi:Asp-tRNA(Asn)/Glu-tRNA(Gln) amidotransferase A subunit family amidase